MLIRDEPLASITHEAPEGYASGRFEPQAEVKRFLALTRTIRAIGTTTTRSTVHR
jgi:hypothetical protein